MTSGWVSATASKSIPSVSSNSTGVSAPSSVSLSSTHGRTPSPSSSPQVALAIPTGTMPSARGTSWFIQATVATRSGLASIVVLPKACSMVTGNAPSASATAVPLGVDEQAASESARAVAAMTPTVLRR